MYLSFARIGPYYLNKLIKREQSAISCETESNENSHSFVQSQIHNGKEFTFEASYDEKEKKIITAVLVIENLKQESLYGNIIRYHYQLKLKDNP